MTKGLTIGLAALLMVGSISPTVLAAEVNKAPINVVADSNSKKKEENERFVERVSVNELTLEEAIRYGTNSSYSLMELELTLESLKENEDKYDDLYDSAESSLESAQKQKAELEKQLEEATSPDSASITSPDSISINLNEELNNLIKSLDELNIQPSDIEVGVSASDVSNGLDSTVNYLLQFLNSTKEYLKVFEKYQQNQLLQEKLNLVNSQITTLSSTISTLEATLNQYDLSRTQTFNNRVIQRESMEVSITSSFLGLMQTQAQIDFMKDSLSTQQSQVNAAKVKYELGFISLNDYEDSKRDLKDLETEIAQLERQLNNDKATFALTIGITYNEDYTLVKPDLGQLALVEQLTSTEELIHNSYNMVNARTALQQAEDRLDDLEDLVENRRKQDEDIAEIDVDIAKLKIESLEAELEKSIKNQFYQVRHQYQELIKLSEDLEVAQKDNEEYKTRFELGLISKLDYDSTNLTVKQAELKYNIAKYQYYLLTKKVELIEDGVIPTN
ncbi:outer membrane protein TolC [Lysinibacillus composti]|nr:TolC family protein [Lysinibacillus composti]MBM7607986.1 outer membrane protein TolC [Lysinibacillus composti]